MLSMTHAFTSTPCHRPLCGAQAETHITERLGWPLPTLLQFPKFLLIETINQCNARCVMCGIDFDSRKKITMSDELFAKIVAELAQHADHVEKVMLYLDNEPLLDRRLHDKIRLVKQAGIRCVNIATNGSLLTRNRTVELIEAGLDEIYITLDSLDKTTYESIRVGLEFERTYQGILAFIEERDRRSPGPKIRLQMIQLDVNRHETDRFSHHWRTRLGPHDAIAIQKAHSWGNQIAMPVEDEASANHHPCIALWGTFVIHAQGQVGMCCVDTGLTRLLGNIANENIADIWNGARLERIRKLHLAGMRSCIPLCNGCTLWREDKRSLESPTRIH
ncbi:MAG: radical SAM protein [Magnetococcales bacterium]|nr:radical SAM protein [Magnetococcales bacterium]